MIAARVRCGRRRLWFAARMLGRFRKRNTDTVRTRALPRRVTIIHIDVLAWWTR